MLVPEMIYRAARRYADQPALWFEGRTRTFAEVKQDADRLALALRFRYGLQRGTPIGILASNGLNSIALDFGCAIGGLLRVPLNARLSSHEQQGMLSRIGVRHLLHTTDLAERARQLAALDPGLSLVSIEDDLLGVEAPDGKLEPAQADDPLIALYTSGTTGTLKAAVHTHGTYAAVVRNILNNLIEPRPGDVMLHAASLIHASGTFVLPYWIRGAAAAILPGFIPSEYLKAVAASRSTALNLVPTMIGMLLETPGVEDADFSHVRDIIYGASPMPQPVLRRAIQTFGPKFSQYYGQTEAPLCITVLDKVDHEDDSTWTACGRPSLDVEIRLLDEAGNEAPVGEPGEIALRAPFVMRGYHQAPDLNAQTFTDDGFIRTRDIGRFDDRGLLYLIDRASDMIVTGGYNVYPREVEDVLTDHPAVIEAVAVGLPDDKWGEAVTGFVILREPVEEDDIIAFCRERLAGYKTPKSIHIVDSLPKSPVGKLLRRAVREPFWTDKGLVR
ncbi:MAG: AMP-binding protein [Caulobacterales bacterium]|nr:AMP-binding protein [Caulobacterales bacterium]